MRLGRRRVENPLRVAGIVDVSVQIEVAVAHAKSRRLGEILPQRDLLRREGERAVLSTRQLRAGDGRPNRPARSHVQRQPTGDAFSDFAIADQTFRNRDGSAVL